MKSLGLDISTYVGMYLVGNEEDRGKCLHFEKARGCSRLQLIANAVRTLMGIWKPDVAVVEGYGFTPRMGKDAIATLVSCGTVVRTTLHECRIPWYEVSPATLKLWTTGKGQAKKDKMAEAVMQRWGFKSHSDDITDAFALAQMGQLSPSDLLSIKGVALGG